jgi:CHAT domain
MDRDFIYRALQNGSPDDHRALLALFAARPPFVSLSAALLDSPNRGAPVTAFGMLTVSYCHGVDPVLGAELAYAAHRFGAELIAAGGDPGLSVSSVSLLAANFVHATNLMGRSEEVIQFAQEWVPFYEQRGDTDNLRTLKAERIKALLRSGFADEAEQCLRDPSLRGSLAADIAVAHHEEMLAALKSRITSVKGEVVAPATPFGSAQSHLDVEGAVRSMLGSGFEDEPSRDRPDGLLGKSPGSRQKFDAADPAQHARLLEALRRGEGKLTDGSTQSNHLTIRARVREAAAVFISDEAPSSAQLRATVLELNECLGWAREHRDTPVANDALWSLYLCHNRLGEYPAGAAMLLELRANLEKARSGIADPMERGGIFGLYPSLFDALCRQLFLADRPAELLEASEAAKGRGIADVLTRKAGRPVADASVYAAARNLPRLTVQYGFHYVTFHVDIDATYSVIVTKRGKILAAGMIALGREEIRNAAAHPDPGDWGYPRDDDPSVRIADASEVLAPLVAWLGDLMRTGEIEPDDHICYAADDELANVPLQYLRFNDGFLVDYVSTSKIHGAFHLDHLLLNDTPQLPEFFLAWVVPTKQDREGTGWLELQDSMRRPTEFLRSSLKGETFEGVEATEAQLATRALRERILHFSTHGVFPSGRSPFSKAGLVLATMSGLPDQPQVIAGNWNGVLTPSIILDRELDLGGSHVSLMACVSGLSREGIGGDALGLEWALIQSGATSLLSSHWMVSARQAAVFFERFYGHWLKGRMSRRRAWCETVRELRQGSDDVKQMRSWAAFSLTGDWR